MAHRAKSDARSRLLQGLSICFLARLSATTAFCLAPNGGRQLGTTADRDDMSHNAQGTPYEVTRLKVAPLATRGELAQSDVEAAEAGFKRLLRYKRFSAAFIERHADDLLAKAGLEYARHQQKGEKVRNPAGWIIHCAWRRTQNLLEQERRAPQAVPIEDHTNFLSESRTPEEEALEADRYRKVQQAVSRLPLEERQVIALTYFEGMSVREAGRTLRWDKCKANRRHNAALERLKELLNVKDLESLEIEIGIAAWATASSTFLPDGLTTVEPALGGAQNALSELFGRGQELARRLVTGGAAEPGMGAAAGSAVRTAGVCGAAAAACLASGLVGPGVGGVDIVSSSPRGQASIDQHAVPAPSHRVQPATVPVLPQPTSADEKTQAAKRQRADRESQRDQMVKRRAKDARRQPAGKGTPVAEEFDPFVPSESTPGESPATSTSPSASRPTTGTGSPPPPAASGAQVDAEFGL